MSTEQTTTPDPAPWTVHFRDGMWEAACSDGSLGGRFPREGDARTFADVAGPGPMTIVSKRRLFELFEQRAERDALSGLLRGMARRSVYEHAERKAWMTQAVSFRAVVDAARAWRDSPSEDSDSADALLDAVAALGWDAAATPQPAAVFGPATECTCSHPVAHHDLEHTFCKAALPDLSGPCPCMRFAVAALDGTRTR